MLCCACAMIKSCFVIKVRFDKFDKAVFGLISKECGRGGWVGGGAKSALPSHQVPLSTFSYFPEGKNHRKRLLFFFCQNIGLLLFKHNVVNVYDKKCMSDCFLSKHSYYTYRHLKVCVVCFGHLKQLISLVALLLLQTLDLLYCVTVA